MTPSKTRHLDAATARHRRMVDRLLDGTSPWNMLLLHIGVIRARFEFYEPEATVDDVFAAVIEAFDLATDHALLAKENGGHFPHGLATHTVEALAPHGFVLTVLAASLLGPVPGLAARFGQPEEQMARIFEEAAGIREALK